LELYANARTSQKAHHATGLVDGVDDGNGGLRPSHQALLRLADTTDPAWPSVAAVLREMADAGVEINEAAVSIAAKLGGRRHRLAMVNPQGTRRGRPAFYQMTLTGTSDSIIYYIRRGDFIKIGTTTDPARRFGALLPDEILAFEPGGEELEKMRHRLFGHLWHRGEYFRIAPELLEYARQIRHLHGDPDPAWPTTATPRPPRTARVSLPPLISHETVTVDEACRRLGLNRITVWGWVHRGLVSPVGQAGRHHLFYIEHLAAIRDRNSPRVPLPARTCPHMPVGS
jgi:hypothetical protein